MDAEVSLNKRRQQVAEVFQDMTQLRSTETLSSNGGTGYRFNAEGNQVSYADLQRILSAPDMKKETEYQLKTVGESEAGSIRNCN